MSVPTSIINNQNADIDRMIAPNSIGLSINTQDPFPYAGAIGYDIIAAELYVGDGVDWVLIDTNPGGESYVAQAPISPTDSNGIIIDNVANTIKLEYASGNMPGIVSNTSQSFNGIKTFTGINAQSLNRPGLPLAIGDSTTSIDIGVGTSTTTQINIGTGVTTTTLGGVVQVTNCDVAPNTTMNVGEHASRLELAKPSGASTIDFNNSTLTGLGDMSLTSAGGNSLVSTGTFPDPVIKGLSAGSGAITITDIGSSLSIDATGNNVSLNSLGSGQSLLYLGGPSLGPTMYVKSIEAGTNITVTDVSGSQLRIDSTSGGVTDVQSTGGSGSSLVNSSSAPTPLIKTISAGTNMTVTDNGTYLTLDASANPPNLSNAGSGSQIFDNNGGGNYGIYSVAAGTGLTVSTSSSTITYTSNISFTVNNTSSITFGVVNNGDGSFTFNLS